MEKLEFNLKFHFVVSKVLFMIFAHIINLFIECLYCIWAGHQYAQEISGLPSIIPLSQCC